MTLCGDDVKVGQVGHGGHVEVVHGGHGVGSVGGTVVGHGLHG